jgi:hypothetical protein
VYAHSPLRFGRHQLTSSHNLGVKERIEKFVCSKNEALSRYIPAQASEFGVAASDTRNCTLTESRMSSEPPQRLSTWGSGAWFFVYYLTSLERTHNWLQVFTYYFNYEDCDGNANECRACNGLRNIAALVASATSKDQI